MATCSFAQLGFVRILSNPACSGAAVAPGEAMRILNLNLAHPSHTFCSDALSIHSIQESLSSCLRCHKQLGDAYLLATVMKRNATIATLDRNIIHLLPDADSQSRYVEVIRAYFLWRWGMILMRTIPAMNPPTCAQNAIPPPWVVYATAVAAPLKNCNANQ